jgi:hypothetical protein
LLASEVSRVRPRLPEEISPELSPSDRMLEEIRLFLGADSVGYLSLESLRRAVDDTAGCFCTSCYTGIYPTDSVQLEVKSSAGATPEFAPQATLDEPRPVESEATRHER